MDKDEWEPRREGVRRIRKSSVLWPFSLTRVDLYNGTQKWKKAVVLDCLVWLLNNYYPEVLLSIAIKMFVSFGHLPATSPRQTRNACITTDFTRVTQLAQSAVLSSLMVSCNALLIPRLLVCLPLNINICLSQLKMKVLQSQVNLVYLTYMHSWIL